MTVKEVVLPVICLAELFEVLTITLSCWRSSLETYSKPCFPPPSSKFCQNWWLYHYRGTLNFNHMSSDAVSDLRKVWVLTLTLKATSCQNTCKREVHPTQIKKWVLSWFRWFWLCLWWCRRYVQLEMPDTVWVVCYKFTASWAPINRRPTA